MTDNFWTDNKISLEQDGVIKIDASSAAVEEVARLVPTLVSNRPTIIVDVCSDCALNIAELLAPYGYLIRHAPCDQRSKQSDRATLIYFPISPY